MDTLPIPPDIRLRKDGVTPIGPGFLPRLANGDLFRENGAEFLLSNARKFGDLVFFKALGRTVLQFNHPELIGEMLVRDAPHHHRNLVMQNSKAVLGNGLLTSEQPMHLRQRRLAQPAFHRERIRAYGGVIGSFTAAMSESWDGAGSSSGSTARTVDVHAAMLLLALRIVGKTLFDTSVEDEVGMIADAVGSFQSFFPLSFLPFSTQIQRLPLPVMRRIRRGREGLDRLIYGMIRERRADGTDRGDLLSMLLAATDHEGDSTGMSDTQVRDECLTILLAGHETTANALCFALDLLARHPEVQTRLAGECHEVLGGRAATADEYSRLRLAEQVFAEALRLYPPVWVTARTVATPYTYRGLALRRGTILVAPQFATHRDPRFYERPLEFDPAWFAPEAKAARPRFAYFPFGCGTRQCIGEGLAWMEGTLILATLVQCWRFSTPESAPDAIAINPSISLRPRGSVHLEVERRTWHN